MNDTMEWSTDALTIALTMIPFVQFTLVRICPRTSHTYWLYFTTNRTETGIGAEMNEWIDIDVPTTESQLRANGASSVCALLWTERQTGG